LSNYYSFLNKGAYNKTAQTRGFKSSLLLSFKKEAGFGAEPQGLALSGIAPQGL
jgi:hypothetical protein